MRYILKSLLLLTLVLTLASAGPVNAGNVTPSIVGGQPAAEGAWPWAAALVYTGFNSYDGQFCGGSLLYPQWVLTASHCVEGLGTGELEVVLGTGDLKAASGSYERIGVTRIIRHPNFGSRLADNDVALVELSSPSAQAAIGSLVTLSDQNQLASPGTPATVIGWGSTRMDPDNEDWPDRLMQVTLPLVSQEVCTQAMSPYGDITDDMICAGYGTQGQDSCVGDSGGPLMVSDGAGGYAQVGVVSWGGDLCAQAGQYGVYARVALFTDWIYSQVGRAVAFVSQLYREALGRAPDSGGLTQKVEALESGSASCADVVREIFNSQEFANRNLSNDEYVETLYRAVFGREADAGGKADWLGQLNAGISRDQVLENFINSEEFRNMCNGFGVRPYEERD